MTDESWRGLETTWERVKWARSEHYESAAAAAEGLGMQGGTYRGYERGPAASKFMRLDYFYARQFSRAFKVRWEWLLEGTGEPWLTRPEEDVDAEASAEADSALLDLEAAPPNKLRDWREHRGLTVAQLARKSGISAQTIQALETGEIDLSMKHMMKLAPALDTTSGNLADRDPRDVEDSLFAEVKKVPLDKRKQALEILKTFRPSGKR
jgi:transcriptional regulator with XRE-family HTH domain